MAEDRLSTYRKKRNTARSGEPDARSRRSKGRARFVIQRHEASTTHFDFRLEADGVLKSWAVPKGPSTDPSQKRLATRTEDHPLDYADYEGRIPEGEYGAGTVVVWDTGEYQHLTEDDGEPVEVDAAIENGHVKFWLDGQKLSGGYALTKMRNRPDRDDWLLVKLDDEAVDRRRNPVRTQPESVLSGRTNDDFETPSE